MGQMSTEIENLTRTGFPGTTVDNPRCENYKMMEMEKDEDKEIDHLLTDIMIT